MIISFFFCFLSSQHTLDKNGGANLAEIQQEQTTLVEQLDVIKKDLLVKIDKCELNRTSTPLHPLSPPATSAATTHTFLKILNYCIFS